MSLEKNELRARYRAARRALPPHTRSSAELRLCAHLASQPALQKAQVIACYDAFDGEPDLSALYATLAARPQPPRLAFPVHTQGEPLRFYEARSWRVVHESYRRPVGPEVLISELDVVLTPGVAFTLRGERLGFGGGFYDRTFPELSEARRADKSPPALSSVPLCFGVAFSAQLAPQLPCEPWDLRVDALVSEGGLLLSSQRLTDEREIMCDNVNIKPRAQGARGPSVRGRGGL